MTTQLPTRRPEMRVGDQVINETPAGTMADHNPATGQHVVDVPIADEATVDAAVRVAAQAAAAWGDLSVRERGGHVRHLAEALRADAEDLARLDAFDSGNPVAAMRKDVEYGIEGLEYFAGIGTELHGKVVPASADGLHMTWREPYGVVARIIPFNHPLMFCAYQAAAPLIAGNAVIIKAPDQTPLAPLEFGRICAEVLPPGLVTVLTGPGAVTGDALVRHPEVRRIAFTGRRETGLTILERSTRAGHVKHVTLELGGKNPLMVMPGTDPEVAAEIAVAGMNFDISQGQSCGSTSRVFVPDGDAAAVTEAIVARLAAIVVGDPLDEATTMGPLVSAAQRDRVAGFVAVGTTQGARLAVGGGTPASVAGSGGYYLEPTLFTDVEAGHDIAREEIFGPVIALRTWTDRDRMIEEVNANRFGLTANILTNDLDLAIDTARRVDTGIVWITAGASTTSPPRSAVTRTPDWAWRARSPRWKASPPPSPSMCCATGPGRPPQGSRPGPAPGDHDPTHPASQPPQPRPAVDLALRAGDRGRAGLLHGHRCPGAGRAPLRRGRAGRHVVPRRALGGRVLRDRGHAAPVRGGPGRPHRVAGPHRRRWHRPRYQPPRILPGRHPAELRCSAGPERGRRGRHLHRGLGRHQRARPAGAPGRGPELLVGRRLWRPGPGTAAGRGRPRPRYGWVWAAAAGLCAVTVALGATAPTGFRTTAPFILRQLLHPAGLLPGLVLGLGLLGYAGFLAFMPLYAEELGLDGAGRLFLLYAALVLGIRMTAPWLVDRIGPHRAGTIALSVTGSGLVVMALLRSTAGLYLGTGVMAVDLSMAFPALMTLAVEWSPPEQRRAVIGTFTAFFDLAQGLGAVVLGLFVGLLGYGGALGLGGLAAFVGVAILALALRPAGTLGEIPTDEAAA